MDWIFENLGKVISFVVFIFYILSSLKGKVNEEVDQDPEAQERARKIQEEIRRKILERQQGGTGSSSPWETSRTPEPVFEEEFVEVEERWGEVIPAREKHSPKVVLEEDVVSTTDRFEEQRKQIKAQLQKAKELREKIRTKNLPVVGRTSKPSRISASQVRKKVESSLQGSESLKAAFVLKEVLDRPLGLR